MSLSHGLSAVGLRPTEPGFKSPNHSPPLTTTSLRSFTKVSTALLNGFIPNYSMLSQVFLTTIGYDIKTAVSVVFVGYTLFSSVNFLKTQTTKLFLRYTTCSVVIGSDVESYHHIMAWLEHKGIGTGAYKLQMLGSKGSGGTNKVAYTFDPFGEHEPEVHSLAKRKGELNFEPLVGLSHYFIHKGRFFVWIRNLSLHKRAGAPGHQASLPVQGQLFCLS